jgi:hypothetical protein
MSNEQWKISGESLRLKALVRWWLKEFRKDNREKHEKCENEYPLFSFFRVFSRLSRLIRKI